MKKLKQIGEAFRANPESDIKYSRDLLVEYVRRWGGSVSNAVLDPACKIFSMPSVEGVIGYRTSYKCAIVWGEPICNPIDIQKLTLAFHQFCQKENHSIIYLGVASSFATWAMEHICNTLIEICEELTLDPYDDPRDKKGANGRLVRRKVRHAGHEGLIAKEYIQNDPKIENEIELVGTKWLQNRSGPQIYTSHVRLFEDRFGKRWFYAQKGENIVGVIVLNQLKFKEGWLFSQLMHTPDAPHGTSEMLVITALERLRKEGCHFATFGPVLADKVGRIVGMSKFSHWLVPKIFYTVKNLFHLDRRKEFWEKYYPQSEASYILFSKPRIGLREILSVTNALNISIKFKQ